MTDLTDALYQIVELLDGMQVPYVVMGEARE